MFETAELGHKISKEVYAGIAPRLREDLLNAQYRLKENGTFPVVILVGGVDGAGRGETVNLLSEWMDPRLIETSAQGDPSDEERERPPMWRFWRILPPKGKIGIIFGSWYTAPIVHRVMGLTKTPQLDQSIAEINRFEKMLCDEGVLLIKFWFHLSKKAQKKRLKELEKNPATRWRVRDTDWERFKIYDKFRAISEHALRQTSTGEAPWFVVEGVNARYRDATVGRILLERVGARLKSGRARVARVQAPPLLSPIDRVQVLEKLDMTQTLSEKNYDRELERWQGRLNLLSRDKKFRRHSVVCVFEGFDAAGKGGAIRRVTRALDARFYRVVPVAAPTEEERAQPYLWRFWRHVPRLGRFAIFDRSWYGRVLVERVENFCGASEWMRAYSEINDFESQLADHGAVVVKFFMAVSKAEQLRRFQERERVKFKQFKITEEDWRNRKKWNLYQQAVSDMVERTSTEIAPWTLVESDDKKFARVKILRALCKSIERTL